MGKLENLLSHELNSVLKSKEDFESKIILYNPGLSKEKKDSSLQKLKTDINLLKSSIPSIIKEILEFRITKTNDNAKRILNSYAIFSKPFETRFKPVLFSLSGLLNFLSDIKRPESYFLDNNDLITSITCLDSFNIKEKNCGCDSLSSRWLSLITIGNKTNQHYQLDYLKGTRNISKNSIIEDEDYERRIIALQENLSFYDRLLKFHLLTGQGTNSECVRRLNSLTDKSRKQLDYLNSIVTKFKDTTSTSVYNWLNGNTLVEDINTNAENIITPDYGLIFCSPGDFLVRPYFGINIGGPINRNIRYSTLKEKLREYGVSKKIRRSTWIRYHLSAHLGVTLSSIEEDNMRDDLFGKSNLVIGVSYRCNRMIRISAGSFLYQIENPNPLISDKTLNTVPYASISFDLSIQKASKNFSSVFLK